MSAQKLIRADLLPVVSHPNSQSAPREMLKDNWRDSLAIKTKWTKVVRTWLTWIFYEEQRGPIDCNELLL
jgi:hypothetical protein